jgi:hypothetical protein
MTAVSTFDVGCEVQQLVIGIVSIDIHRVVSAARRLGKNPSQRNEASASGRNYRSRLADSAPAATARCAPAHAQQLRCPD